MALLRALAAFVVATGVARGALAAPTKAEPKSAFAPLVAGDVADGAAAAKALREHYTKHEVRIPMRDGVRLFTAIYVPKDTARTYPLLMVRTPYSVAPYGADNYPNGDRMPTYAPSPRFVKNGYIFVLQDVRGRMMSEGTFADVRPAAAKGGTDEATDAWDTVDWLVKHVAGNNGKLGAWGVSYPGFYAAQVAVDAHPAVKAVSPQAPVTEWFIGDDFHHNGAFFLAQAFDFYRNFGRPRPEPVKNVLWERGHDGVDTYDFFLALGPLANADAQHFKGERAFWKDIMAHGTRDAFWEARDPRPRYRDVKPAVMTVGGLFDAEDLWGAFATYRAFETQSPAAAKNTLVMGPWRHGGWARDDGDKLGDVTFAAKTSAFFRDEIELAFFEHNLRGAPEKRGAEAWVFQTGTNAWHAYPSWPPPGARSVTYFLGPKGALSTTAPGAASAPNDPGFDAYVSDPRRPVPYRAGMSGSIQPDFMTADQRFASRRPDVLTYATAELADDVTLDGPIEATLHVSVTGTDADFVVKVVDVYPDDIPDPKPNPTGVRLAGYQQLVRAEVMRAKFRDAAFAKPAPLRPNEATIVKIALPDVAHTFRSGHRIMLQIQSSWFPLVDRNPQTFCDIYAAKEADFREATHRVLRTAGHASSVTMTVSRGAITP